MLWKVVTRKENSKFTRCQKLERNILLGEILLSIIVGGITPTVNLFHANYPYEHFQVAVAKSRKSPTEH